MIFVKGSLLLFVLVITIFAPLTFADSKIFFSETQLEQYGFKNYEDINTNQLIYPFKKYYENIFSFFTFNKSGKKNYLMNLYNKRFKELVYIINYDKTGFLLETVDRYNTFVGRVKNEVILNEKQKQQIANNLKLLEKLRDRYHSGSAYWIKIQEAVDTTKSLI